MTDIYDGSDVSSDFGDDYAEFAPEDIDSDFGDSYQIDDALLDEVTSVYDTNVGNFSESGMTNTQEVANYIDESIPQDHLEGLDSIEYVNSDEAREEGILGMWVDDPEVGTVEIDVYPHDDVGELYDTVSHEIGHNAEEKIPTSAVNEWDNLYYDSSLDYIFSLGEDNRFVTDYATTSTEEDFAETYSFYINDPEMVQAICPDKYDFMKDHVFNGKEFL